jgi:hypothetical protein
MTVGKWRENREYHRDILCSCPNFKRGPSKYKSEVSYGKTNLRELRVARVLTI